MSSPSLPPRQMLSDMFDDVPAGQPRSRSATPNEEAADAAQTTPQRPPKTSGLFLQPSPSSAGGSPIRARGDEQRSNKRRRLAELARTRQATGEAGGAGDSDGSEDIQRAALAMFDDVEAEDAAVARASSKNPGILDPLAVSKPDGATTGGSEEKKEDVAAVGGRAPRARLDEQRLLGDRGFPLLLKTAKKFKIQGKGHEAEDLSRLISTYQIWAHQMYPRASFKDAVTKIESLCHSRGVQSTVRRWRDDEELERNAREAAARKSAEMRPGGTRNPIFSLLDLQDALSGSALRSSGRADDEVDDYKEQHGITHEAIEIYAARMEQEPERVVTLQDLIRASGGATEADEGQRQALPLTAPYAVAAASAATAHDDEDDDIEAMVAAAEAEAAELQQSAGINDGGVASRRDDFEDDWQALDELMA